MITKQSVFSNFIWKFLERSGAQLVTFITSIILARILEPSVYGNIALVNVFIVFFSIFLGQGLRTSLIQKKDANELDYNTVFFSNLFLCFILYLILFISAPYISVFYDNKDLTLQIRILGLTLIISAFESIQSAYIEKNLIFKKFFFATLSGTIGAGIIGIIMAQKGFGVWALIIQSLFNNLVDTIILWFTVKWKPKRLFSFSILKEHFNYGWKMILSSFINSIYTNLSQLIIGKFYTKDDLAFYNRGDSYPNLIIFNINTSIDVVMFPVLTDVQNNLDRLKDILKRNITITTYLIFPMLIGLAACTPSLISVLLTEKWLPSSFYMIIFSLSYITFPLKSANQNALKALGKSSLYLKLEIISKILGFIVLIISIFLGVKAIAISVLVTAVITQIVFTIPNKKLINYGLYSQLKDILPNIINSSIMGIIVACFNFIPTSTIIKLFIQIPLGIIIYIIISLISKNNSFYYVLSVIKGIKK